MTHIFVTSLDDLLVRIVDVSKGVRTALALPSVLTPVMLHASHVV